MQFSSKICLLLICNLIGCQLALGQRDSDDDFDDAGFDDTGYNSPQAREAEGSNQNPSNYSPSSEEDLDDDDDVDETHVRPQLATASASADQQPAAGQWQTGARRFYSPANSVLLANVDPSAANYNGHQLRYRRSPQADKENDIEQPKRVLKRQKRYSKKYIGPVYTYVKTDKHAHYKWGVKHKVGKHYG